MDLEHNAGEVAGDLERIAGELLALEAANVEAGRLALVAIDAETPRQSGTLAAGARTVADSYGFAYVNATRYAVFVDARTGFATDTLKVQEARILSVYEQHVEQAVNS